MISVLIPTLNDEARLAAALAPMVPASMDGVVRELIVVDRGSTDATLEIADDAGAIVVSSEGPGYEGLQEAFKLAKGPWILLVDPSVRLDFGWEAEAKRHMERSKSPARFKLERTKSGLFDAIQRPRNAAHLFMKSEAERVAFAARNGVLEPRLGHADLLNARGGVI